MRSVVLAHEVDHDGWRQAVRGLIAGDIRPEQVSWSIEAPDDLFAAAADPDAPPLGPAAPAFALSRPLVELSQTVLQARDPARFALLYGLVWRATHGERGIAGDLADPSVARARQLAQSVARDTHKMRAFLRFREIDDGTGEGGLRHVAWFEPEHYIVEANAGFFIRRFAAMRFSILTPYRSLHWDGAAPVFAPGARASDIPGDDAMAEYWETYFRSIFNPARLKRSAMLSEMPRKYWRNMPETAAIAELIRDAPRRAEAMVAARPTAPRVNPPRAALAKPAPVDASDLAGLAAEAQGCRNCPLWQPATQTVFGEGPGDARVMLVGEQPGDQEDLAGRPFVGPAGQLLDRALAEAGIDRGTLYVTNAVKHFKFTPRGKRRIHQKPEVEEITACTPWLARERALVAPKTLVMLGATAARAILGRPVTISRERGRPVMLEDGSTGWVTVHPSYLLRLPDAAAREREYAAFVEDLRRVRTS